MPSLPHQLIEMSILISFRGCKSPLFFKGEYMKDLAFNIKTDKKYAEAVAEKILEGGKLLINDKATYTVEDAIEEVIDNEIFQVVEVIRMSLKNCTRTNEEIQEIIFNQIMRDITYYANSGAELEFKAW